MGVSGMVAEGGVPMAVATEEQKKKRAGVGVETERENWTRLWTPLTCCSSKLRMPKLKFTAHALEIVGVSMLFSKPKAE